MTYVRTMWTLVFFDVLVASDTFDYGIVLHWLFFIVVLFFPHWLVLVSSDQREEISTDTQKHAAILDNTGDSVFWFLEAVKVWMGGNRLTPNLSKLKLLFVHQSCSMPLALFLGRVGLPLKEEIYYLWGVPGFRAPVGNSLAWMLASECMLHLFCGPCTGFSLGSECSLKCWF